MTLTIGLIPAQWVTQLRKGKRVGPDGTDLCPPSPAIRGTTHTDRPTCPSRTRAQPERSDLCPPSPAIRSTTHTDRPTHPRRRSGRRRQPRRHRSLSAQPSNPRHHAHRSTGPADQVRPTSGERGVRDRGSTGRRRDVIGRSGRRLRRRRHASSDPDQPPTPATPERRRR